MNFARTTLLALCCMAATMAFAASGLKPVETTNQGPAPLPDQEKQKWMVEGEKSYRTNCGRCHQPPHKYAPRAMAMAVRQMRVRAMLSEDEMKYVLYYVTH